MARPHLAAAPFQVPLLGAAAVLAKRREDADAAAVPEARSARLDVRRAVRYMVSAEDNLEDKGENEERTNGSRQATRPQKKRAQAWWFDGFVIFSGQNFQHQDRAGQD